MLVYRDFTLFLIKDEEQVIIDRDEHHFYLVRKDLFFIKPNFNYTEQSVVSLRTP